MRVLAVIQARMGSNRLPGKVMKELEGNPMIYQTLTRLSKSRYIDQIVLATSDRDNDTPLAEYVQSTGFDVFRGDEQNVLGRFKAVSDLYQNDVMVRITGDCPLIDPILVDRVITQFLIEDKDYIRLDVPSTYVRGFDVEVFRTSALDKVWGIVNNEELLKDEQSQMYTEHVTYYMYTHQEDFKVGYVKGEENTTSFPNLSVDTLEDFERVKELIHFKGYGEILNVLKKKGYQ